MADSFLDIQTQLESAATDPQLDPSERSTKIRALRDRLIGLCGMADRHLSDVEKLREAQASDGVRNELLGGEHAGLREDMVESGEATEAELDAAGVVPPDEVARLHEEGLLPAYADEHAEAAKPGEPEPDE